MTIFIGRKGSGKSHLLCRLLKDKRAWRGIYDEIIFVSPTFRSQFEKLWSQLAPDGITVHEQLTEEFLTQLLQSQSNSTQDTLLILDDCGDDIKRISPSTINKLVSNSRHYKLSMISLHQKLTQAPTILRANADCVISFSASAFLEREALWREMAITDRKTFLAMFNTATEQKHSFLVCTLVDGRLRFFQGLEHEL